MNDLRYYKKFIGLQLKCTFLEYCMKKAETKSVFVSNGFTSTLFVITKIDV